ncbi:LysR family transcriptional regulator [Pontibacterium sp. N1Y112]|uniref:LysR family transcriptional regulator n=1 Tax=Pontibacterium sinense TaxID=2781979 RepID=A0A8J7FD23_9GAMM|nr:LysR family transcriptional regulator [Pontibacterium sinense]MBE9397461.1 LysR family transcriptional regulator [Pontibacterium sinense]
MKTQVSLEQWQALIAVVEHGGYAQAAEALNKSQSAVSYAIQKLESSLGIPVLAIQGRKAELTPAGQILLQRAKTLVHEAQQIEALAAQFGQEWEAELNIAVDTLFPPWLLLDALSTFSQDAPHTRVDMQETVLSGTYEALVKREVNLGITGSVPPGFLADPLLLIRFIAVAHPDYPLHQLNRSLTYQDLRQHCQLVVRDSGSQRADSGWLGSQQRLTLSNQSTSIQAACKGLGYAWFPEVKIREELEQGHLKPLPMLEGSERRVQLYLVYSQGDYAGRATRHLGELIRSTVAQHFPEG